MMPRNPVRHLASAGDLTVLYVMATEQEYGAHLRRLIAPLITGVGPVEAAATTGAALGALYALDRLPDLVCSLGSAGSRKLEHAGVYQITSVSYRDMDASPLGFEKGVTPFLDEPAEISIPYLIPDIPGASISTGGGIISGLSYYRLAADMVDMESYAVLRAAHRFGVPMIGLRGISDGKSELTGLHDWTEYLHVIDERLAAAVEDFDRHVMAGRFVLTGRRGGPGDPPPGVGIDDRQVANTALTRPPVKRDPEAAGPPAPGDPEVAKPAGRADSGATSPSNGDNSSNTNEGFMKDLTPSGIILFFAGVLATAIGAIVAAVFMTPSSTRAMDMKMVDIAIGILSQPPTEATTPARDWAVRILHAHAGVKPNSEVRQALTDHQAMGAVDSGGLVLAEEIERLRREVGSLRTGANQQGPPP